MTLIFSVKQYKGNMEMTFIDFLEYLYEVEGFNRDKRIKLIVKNGLLECSQ
jgi:hypothetical protein